mmetsp:Transcript_48690/g.135385  ORF Transcript_48690/g.135385 Transcript_48690/m.135385 type:complete len:291 (-) Transcript_48690:669-1541(-)
MRRWRRLDPGVLPAGQVIALLPLHQNHGQVVSDPEAGLGVPEGFLAGEVIAPSVAGLGQLRRVATVPHDLVPALHVVEVHPDVVVLPACDGQLLVVHEGHDLHGCCPQAVVAAQPVQHLEEVEAAPAGEVVVPEGVALALHVQRLGAVVYDGHALHQHGPRDGVEHAGGVALAGVGQAVLIVVVHKVPQGVQVPVGALVVYPPNLLDHPLGQEGQVARGPREPRVAERRPGGVVEREVEDPVQARPAMLPLYAGVVAHVRGCDLAYDRHADRLLQLSEEVKRQESGRVEP